MKNAADKFKASNTFKMSVPSITKRIRVIFMSINWQNIHFIPLI